MTSASTRRKLQLLTLEARVTPSTTPQLLKEINAGGDANPSQFAILNGNTNTQKSMFVTSGPTANDLWFSDGTNAGTVLAKAGGSFAIAPTQIIGATVDAGDRFFFRAADTGTNTEPWISDGTPAGTVPLIEIGTTTTGSLPGNFTVVPRLADDPIVFFTATSAAGGTEFWKYQDGSVSQLNFSPGTNNTEVLWTGTFGNRLIFIGRQDTTGSVRIYKSDSTFSTFTSEAVVADTIRFNTVTVINNTIFFGTTNNRLYRYNDAGTPGSKLTMLRDFTTNTAVTSVAALNGFVYFDGFDATNGTELWRSNGSTTALFSNINTTAAASSSLANLLTVGSRVFFSATNGTTTGIELYSTNGSALAFHGDFNNVTSVNSGNSNPTNFRNANGTLIYTATNAADVAELLRVDPINSPSQTVGATPVQVAPNLTTYSVDFANSNFGGELAFLRANTGTGTEPHTLNLPPNAPRILAFGDDLGVSTSDGITSDNTLQLSGVTDAPGLTINIYKTNGGTTLLDTFTSTGVNWVRTLPVLADGLYDFRVEAVDPSGQLSGLGTTFSVTIDTVAPTTPVITSMDVDSGIPTDGVTNDSFLDLSGTAEANADVELFDFLTSAVYGNATANGSGNWVIVIPSELGDGPYDFRVRSSDVAGNLATGVSFPVTIDTVAPAIPTITSFSNNTGSTSDNLTNDTTITLTGGAEPNSTVAVFDGVTSLGTTTTDGGGVWTFTTAVLPEGLHTFTASASDLAANSSNATAGFPVEIDTTLPAAPVITGYTDDTNIPGDGITSDPTLILSGTTSNEAVSVEIFNGVTSLGFATQVGTNWSFATASLTDGAKAFKAVARDAADNASPDSAVLNVTVDTVAPVTPAITSYSSDSGTLGDFLTNDNTITLNGTGEANSSLRILDGANLLATITVGGGGTWTHTTGTLADGVKNFIVESVDAAGNVSGQGTFNAITVDATLPQPTIITGIVPGGPGVIFGGLSTANTLIINGLAPEGGLTVRLYDGLTLLTTVTSPPNGTFSFTTGVLSDGIHTFYATATDNADNFSGNGPSVVIDVQSSVILVNTSGVEDAKSINTTGTQLLSTFFGDPNPNPLKGVAITALTGSGTWYYTINKTTFIKILPTDVGPTKALLLRDIDTLRFVPNLNVNGLANVTIQAWDRTTGKEGERADATVNGTLTAFSTLSRTVSIGIAAVNDRPTLSTIDSPILPTSALTTGAQVLSLIAGRFQEVDATSNPGIAITGRTGTGVWSFSVDGGTTWFPLGTPSAAAARLLRQNDLVRFIPTSGFVGLATLIYRAWDGSTGTAGGTLTATNGSIATASTTATLAAGNIQPVLSDSLPNLPSVPEGSKTHKGETAQNLVGPSFSDANAKSSRGMAVVGIDNTFGKWQWSPTGAVWTDIVSASPTNALLIGATQRLRFLPNAGFVGSSTVQYVAWDGSAGVAGKRAKTSDGTSFGAFVETASVNVIQTATSNDRPLLAVNTATQFPAQALNVANSPGVTVASLLGTNVTDPDSATIGIAVTGSTGTGWQYDDLINGFVPLGVNSVASAKLLLPSWKLRYVSGATTELPTLSFKAWDGSAGIAGINTPTATSTAFSTAIEIATIAIGNTAPTLNNAPSPTLPNVIEEAKTATGSKVSDLLAGAFSDTPANSIGSGIAVTTVDSANGKWQWSPTGAVWTTIAGVAANKALLLADTARVRFIPNPNYSGGSTFSYVGWDRTGGATGEFADSSRVDLTSFSSASETAAITVTAVNDKPVLSTLGAPTLTPVAIAAVNPAGSAVSTLINPLWASDVDGNSLGIAITAATGDGTWQYFDATWQNIVDPLNKLSATKAFLLAPATLIRFVPNPLSTTAQTATISFKLWDQTFGLQAQRVNSALGTAFSTIVETATLSVGNSAPTL